MRNHFEFQRAKALKIGSNSFRIIFLALAMISEIQDACAGTQGHYYPGVMGIRDVILPPKGIYAIYYDPIYYSDNLRNAGGHTVSHISISESKTKYFNVYGHDMPVQLSVGMSANIDASMMFTTEQLLLLWVTKWRILGADYAMMAVPSAGFVGVQMKMKAHVSGTMTIGHLSRTVNKNETLRVKSDVYGFGDLLVMPVMLDWRGKQYDIGVYYGFNAPTGTYSKKRIANVGMGFWTQQLKTFGAWYFDEMRKTALVAVGTYNINSSKFDLDVTPGMSMTLEYGLSHYATTYMEIGVYGYDQWQISPDSGSAAKNKGVFYQIHGVGGQMGGWMIKEKLNITVKCAYEYYGVDRFSGILGTVNFIGTF